MYGFATKGNLARHSEAVNVDGVHLNPCAHSAASIMPYGSIVVQRGEPPNSLTVVQRCRVNVQSRPENSMLGLTRDPSGNRQPMDVTGYGAANILLVDDDLVDRMAFRRTSGALGITNAITEATDGVVALEILRTKDIASHLRAGIVVFLDLRMPRMSGLEFLNEICCDVLLRSTPVFVLTGSSADECLVRSSARNVVGFVNKHSLARDLREIFMNLVRSPAVVRPTR